MADDVVTLEIVSAPSAIPAADQKMRRLGAFSRELTRQTHRTAVDADGWEHYAWTVRLVYQGRTMDTPWRAGIANVTTHRYVGELFGSPEAPTAARILEALFSDASCYDGARDFEDFAADLGYDSDSRKAEETYRACGRIGDDLAKLLNVDRHSPPWMDPDPDNGQETAAARYAGTLEEVTP